MQSTIRSQLCNRVKTVLQQKFKWICPTSAESIELVESEIDGTKTAKETNSFLFDYDNVDLYGPPASAKENLRPNRDFEEIGHTYVEDIWKEDERRMQVADQQLNRQEMSKSPGLDSHVAKVREKLSLELGGALGLFRRFSHQYTNLGTGEFEPPQGITERDLMNGLFQNDLMDEIHVDCHFGTSNSFGWILETQEPTPASLATVYVVLFAILSNQKFGFDHKEIYDTIRSKLENAREKAGPAWTTIFNHHSLLLSQKFATSKQNDQRDIKKRKQQLAANSGYPDL